MRGSKPVAALAAAVVAVGAYTAGASREPERAEPFKRFESREGKAILVGKGAAENDELSFKVARGSDLLLVDTGIGDKLDPKLRELYALDPEAVRLPEAIRRAGYELGDVTHVLLSHLHFDHCGWNTREAGGRLVPTFPHARYFLSRGEVEHARNPNERDRASYMPPNWEPLDWPDFLAYFESGRQAFMYEESPDSRMCKIVKSRAAST